MKFSRNSICPGNSFIEIEALENSNKEYFNMSDTI